MLSVKRIPRVTSLPRTLTSERAKSEKASIATEGTKNDEMSFTENFTLFLSLIYERKKLNPSIIIITSA